MLNFEAHVLDDGSPLEILDGVLGDLTFDVISSEPLEHGDVRRIEFVRLRKKNRFNDELLNKILFYIDI